MNCLKFGMKKKHFFFWLTIMYTGWQSRTVTPAFSSLICVKRVDANDPWVAGPRPFSQK